MTRLAPLALALALAGCYDVEDIPPGPSPVALPLTEPGLYVELNEDEAAMRPVIEEIAAVCWLDNIVGAAVMTVDRDTGHIEMSDDTGQLLAVTFLPTRDLASIRISGPVTLDPGRAELLLDPIAEQQRTGRYDCPPPAVN